MRERGSVLMLMPAAVLVVLVLAAIAVDLSARFVGQREAIAAAEGAANDAVSAGVDLRSLDGPTPPTLDPAAARRVALRSLAAQGVLDQLVGSPQVSVPDPTTVVVRLRVRVRPIFSSAETVEATATAHLVAR